MSQEAPGTPEVALPLIHRDLSWLEFNDRVLAEARDKTNPLLERAKFLSITASNLDEFFMIRLASLRRSLSLSVRQGTDKQSKFLQRVHTKLVQEVKLFTGKQRRTLEELRTELASHGISLVIRAADSPETLAAGEAIFSEQILPALPSPEPFKLRLLPLMGNLETAIVGPGSLWIPVPKTLPLSIWKDNQIFFLDDLLLQFMNGALGLLPPKTPATPQSPSPLLGLLRLTRDGDFSVDLEEEDTESIPDIVRSGIRRRERGRPVRLQYVGAFPESFLKQCASILKLDPVQVLQAPHTLGLNGLWSAVNQAPPSLAANTKLAYPPFVSRIPKSFRGGSNLFESLQQSDILLHHPYDSFDSFVTWIRGACADPQVESIELTVYRTDAVSPLLEALKSAAKTKTVRVIIELRARFDELNNLRLADELRQAGVQVAFGLGKLKLHAKIALVTRKEGELRRHYTHLSTGNYNAGTARAYTDLAILTANADVGADVRSFFDSAWEGKLPGSFKQLVSAPTRLHRRMLAHIDSEIREAKAGKSARIVAKVNALVDESIIEHLYRASSAGVQVDLIVRGACSLVPGVKGVSENIRVISIVDRFLEHSRIYYFGASQVMYLSSADWMPRNFFSRLELAYPVLDPKIHAFLRDTVLPTYLGDTVKARELNAQGSWRSRSAKPGEKKIRSQFYFQELAQNDYQGTPIE